MSGPADTADARSTVAQPTLAFQGVSDVSKFLGPSYGQVHAIPVDGLPQAKVGWLAETLYRGFEIVVALAGLIIGLPFMLAEAVLIRMDSPGPVLFFQNRVAASAKLRGRDVANQSNLIPPPGGWDPNGVYYVPRVFRFLKFRTMYHDARQRFPELYAYKYDPQEFRSVQFKNDNDPRVTRVGMILRRLTVDELPNLWCVLIGDMRLVGPRPELPEIPRYYSPEEMYKFACKPGITGLAQINGRGLLTWGETLAWDLKYVQTRTVWLDLKVIALTLWYVVVQRGAF